MASSEAPCSPSGCGMPSSVQLPRSSSFIFSSPRPRPRSTLFPYATLFRSVGGPVSLGLLKTPGGWDADIAVGRSEEHTSELQSQSNLVCRLLLEKKNDARHDGTTTFQVATL